MTQKLLLAEGLDLLRQCEIKEYDLDKTKERVRSSAKYKGELSRLVQNYYSVYDQFVRGVEILNYLRHQALDDPSPQSTQYNKNLADFCAGKMSAYMDRCDNIIRKVDSILLPLDQVDLVTKEGYVPEETLYIRDGTNYPLTRKESTLTTEFTLMDGTYVLTIKNTDTYSIAAPGIDVFVTITPQRGSGAEPQRLAQSVPVESGWRKVVGVTGAATLQLEVRCSGIRDAHVDVLLQKWRPANAPPSASEGPGDSPFRTDFTSDFAPVTKPGTSDYGDAAKPAGGYGPDQGAMAASAAPQTFTSGLPAIPDDDLAALANYNVPQNQLPPRGAGGGGAAAAGVGSMAAAFGGGAAAATAQPSAQDPWDALEHLNVPHVGAHARGSGYGTRVPDPVEVNPSGQTCKERLGKVRDMLNAWPTEGVPMMNLPSDKQRIVQSVYALPLPREMN